MWRNLSPVCAAVDVEMRFGAAGSGGAGCPSWALASIGPSSFFGEGGREVRREESVTCRKKARYARPSLGQGPHVGGHTRRPMWWVTSRLLHNCGEVEQR